MTANVGDTIIFSWYGWHNVYLMPSQTAMDNCDFSGATEEGTSSPVTFTITSLPVYFACAIGQHCTSGQYMEVTQA